MYVKICGITNSEDAQVAQEAGADLLGFVFYARSPRYVAPEIAQEVIAGVRRSGPVRTVGVFVNESVENIRAIAEQCDLDLVQLHGDETPEMVRALAPRAFKALRPRDPAAACAQLERFRPTNDERAPALLVDAFNPQLFGGTGEQADWKMAREIAQAAPILLAGGLVPENVAEAIAAVQPWGVDVSSGVERAPGLKDHARVREFIERAKGTAK